MWEKRRIVMDVPVSLDKLIEEIANRTGTNKTSVYKLLIDIGLKVYNWEKKKILDK